MIAYKDTPAMSAVNAESMERTLSGTRRRMCLRIIPRLLFALAVVGFPASSHPDVLASQTTNLERLQTCAAALSDSLLASLTANESRELCVRVVDHPASWIVEQSMTRMMEERGFVRVPCNPLPPNDLLIAITNIGIRYVELDDPDFFRREVKLGLSASVPKQQGTTRAVRHVTETREIVLQDTIEAGQTSLLEAPGYSFTIGTAIQRNRSSVWSKIVEPAVVIGSTVVMVILLFTTRSQ